MCRERDRLYRDEGVGEHVRTRFSPGKKASSEIADPKTADPHRTKKACFFCRTDFESAERRKARSNRLT